ncbi:hypothetical protein HDU91_004135 [Kappamyces sp. JEL0680]|nr:hypothetical protein HDU91_004135 [Kappamyces sp. JEL0680]
MKYWIGVACKSHVERGTTGGFCQLCHGKEAPLKRMKPGDWLVYYSPRLEMDAKSAAVQAFTAIGQVADGTVVKHQTPASSFHRLNIRYATDSNLAPIRPLIDRLGFIRNKQRWGMAFRKGHFQIDKADFQLIASAMGMASFCKDKPVSE